MLSYRYFITSMVVWTLPPLGAMVWYGMAYLKLYQDKVKEKWNQTSKCHLLIGLVATPLIIPAVLLCFVFYVCQFLLQRSFSYIAFSGNAYFFSDFIKK